MKIRGKCTKKVYWNYYEGVSKSFRTGRVERGLQMVQLSATRCSYIAILWVSLVSFAAITIYVASQLEFIIIVVVCFVIDLVRKLLDTPSYVGGHKIVLFSWKIWVLVLPLHWWNQMSTLMRLFLMRITVSLTYWSGHCGGWRLSQIHWTAFLCCIIPTCYLSVY
jgi:hypothetical protein